MSDQEITPGELRRRLEQVEAAERERRYVTLERYDADQKTTNVLFQALTDAVRELKDNQKWATRTIAVAFLGLLIEGLLVVLK